MSRISRALTVVVVLALGVGGPAASEEVCRNLWDSLIAEVQIAVSFKSGVLNTEETFRHLEPRISGSEADLEGRAWETTLEGGRHIGTYCLDLGDIEEIALVPTAFDFWLGPRRIPLRLAELPSLAAPILVRGSKTDTERANVVRIPGVIELEPQSDPNWVEIELAELVRLANGQVALHLKAFHRGQLRAPDIPISLYATNSGAVRCASGSAPISGAIRVKQFNGSWIGSSTNISFGIDEQRPVSVEVGACDELDLRMSLGALPALNGGGELLVSFAFANVLTGPGAGLPFWEVFHQGGSISLSGDRIWPKRIGLSVP